LNHQKVVWLQLLWEVSAEYTLYVVFCKSCNKYKRILSSAPAGPGGTLSCPICGQRKENGPHLEGAYGSVRTKSFKIILPKEVDQLGN